MILIPRVIVSQHNLIAINLRKMKTLRKILKKKSQKLRKRRTRKRRRMILAMMTALRIQIVQIQVKVKMTRKKIRKQH